VQKNSYEKIYRVHKAILFKHNNNNVSLYSLYSATSEIKRFVIFKYVHIKVFQIPTKDKC
jgi:hypothetical protein